MKVRLGDLLVEQGLITEKQLASALEHQRRHPGFRKLGEIILQLHLVTEEQMLRALAKALRMQAIDLRKVTRVDPMALQTVSVETAERELVMPLRVVQHGASKRLQVAMADPTNLEALDELQFRLGCRIEARVSTISHVRDAIRRFYRGPTDPSEGVIEIEPTQPSDESAHLISSGEMKTWVGDPADDDLQRGYGARIVELRFHTGPRKGKAIQIPDGAVMVFGRSPEVDITVEDHRMSRRHFQVSARANGVELADLGSSNGTFVNKKQVGRATLNDGDWVQAGSTLIKVELVEPV